LEPIAFNPVVVAPTYNNARTLGEVIDGVRALGLPLIVVNDGSTDATQDVLSARSHDPLLILVTHVRNRGKAAALRSGFAAASDAEYTHAVSIDTDGQHDPAEIPKLLERARQSPQALILGLRDESAPGYPSKSRLGRRVSNLFIRMECGLRVDDSQCGLRVYPLGLVRAVRAGAARFGFETEIVTRAGWAGCEVIEVPVACRYLPPGERVSHLNPFVDTLRGFGMHGRLLTRAMLPWPRHPKWPDRQTAVDRRRLHRKLLDWLNPVDAWRQARRDRVGREAFAAGLALGAFIGNLPTYGLHAFLGLYAARRLHMHPVPVVIGTHISTPPVGPVLNAVAIAVGHLILHRSLPSAGDYNFHDMGFLGVLRRMLLEWVIGSPIVGLVCTFFVFVISNRLLKLAAAKDQVTANAASAKGGDSSSAAPQTDRPESQATRPAGSAPGHAA
jgi:uncharacterized protein (DUF2062 family)